MTGPGNLFDDDERFSNGGASRRRYHDEEYLGGGRRVVVRIQPGSGPEHGPYVRYQGPINDARATRFSFSRQELQHLAVATACLTVAFGFGIMGGIGRFNPVELVIGMFIAAVAVGTGFLLHEMAHKFVAQYYGYWAEFRYNLFGLGLAMFLGIISGFVFAAPGAVYISGLGISRAENGKISAAGPATNLVLAGVFFTIFLLLGRLPVLGTLAFYGLWINLILGCFNLLPIGPLDGKKILKWSPPVYVVMCILLGGPMALLMLLSFGVL